MSEDRGRLLLERRRPAAEDGLKWDYAPGAERLYPNFLHGTAGIANFLATGEREFLEAAKAGATYLRAVASDAAGGFKVFHHTPGGEDLYYLGWCHGPVGASQLFYRLAEIAGEEQWTELVRRSAHALLESGILEERRSGRSPNELL